MGPSEAIEALYAAHSQRATGELVFKAGTRESQLSWKDGDVVDAQFGFGHVTLVQSLFASGRLPSAALDAIWARGEAGIVEQEALELAKVDVEQARRLQLVGALWRASELAEAVEFRSGDVAAREAVIPGASFLRAAFEALPSGTDPTQQYFFCPDLAACDSWALTDADREWLSQFAEGATRLEGLSASQKSLLALLVKDGKVQALSEPEWVESQRNAERARAEHVPPPQPEEIPAPSDFEMHSSELQRFAAEEAFASAAVDQTSLPETADAAAALSPDGDNYREAPLSPEWPVSSAPQASREVPSLWNAGESPQQSDGIEAAASEAADGLRDLPTFDAAELSTPPSGEPDWGLAAPSPEDASAEDNAWGFTAPPMLQRRATTPTDVVALAGDATTNALPVSAEADAWSEAPQARIESTPRTEEWGAPTDEAPSSRRTQTAEWDAPAGFSASPTQTSRPERPAPDARPAAHGTGDWPGASWGDAVASDASAGRAASSLEDVDLWNLVQGQGAGGETLEDALSRTDDSLRDMMSLQLPETVTPAPPVAEPTLELTFEESLKSATIGPPAGDALGAWQWDEDDLAADPLDPAEAARLRRQRLLRRAVENLGGIPQRPVPVESGVEVVQPPAAAAPESPQPERTGDDKLLATLIDKRHEELKAKPDYFTILGLDRAASKEQVKSAFLSLAKVFHPDRLPPSISHLAPKMTQIFESIRESYETLYDDAKRENYASSLADRETMQALHKVTPVEEGAEAFKRGENAQKRRDFVTAELEFQQAFNHDNKGTYLAARAWILYSDPARKDAAGAKQMLSEALKLDPKCDRAHYHMGIIARVEHQIDQAERHFRDVVRLNPKHVEANQELRLIEMRKKKSK